MQMCCHTAQSIMSLSLVKGACEKSIKLNFLQLNDLRDSVPCRRVQSDPKICHSPDKHPLSANRLYLTAHVFLLNFPHEHFDEIFSLRAQIDEGPRETSSLYSEPT